MKPGMRFKLKFSATWSSGRNPQPRHPKGSRGVIVNGPRMGAARSIWFEVRFDDSFERELESIFISPLTPLEVLAESIDEDR